MNTPAPPPDRIPEPSEIERALYSIHANLCPKTRPGEPQRHHAECTTLSKLIVRLDQSETELIRRAEFAEGWADKLAYAVGDIDEIGEHSNLNSPWEQAYAIVRRAGEVKAIEEQRDEASRRADLLSSRARAAEAEKEGLAARLAEIEGTGVDLRVLVESYAWTVDVDGNICGCLSGDMGYEPLGLELEKRTREFINGLGARLKAAEAEVVEVRAGWSKVNEEIVQTLGRALGYPQFADDQKNFPGATDADGVAVAEHTAETIAEAAAERLKAVEADAGRLRAAVHAYLALVDGPLQRYGWQTIELTTARFEAVTTELRTALAGR